MPATFAYIMSNNLVVDVGTPQAPSLFYLPLTLSRKYTP